MDLSPFHLSQLKVPTTGKAALPVDPWVSRDTQMWTDSFSNSVNQDKAWPYDGAGRFYHPKEGTRASLPRGQGKASPSTIKRASVGGISATPSVAAQEEERQTQFFKTKLCPYHLEGRCINGNNCRFAHAPNELRPLPDLQKTKLCESYVRKEPCTNPRCPFAHNPCELRTSSYSFYKVALCNFYKKGLCWNGMHCRFAHGIGELQAALNGGGNRQAPEQFYDDVQFEGQAQLRDSSPCSESVPLSKAATNSAAASLSHRGCVETSPAEKPSNGGQKIVLQEETPGLQKSCQAQQIIRSLVQLLMSSKDEASRGVAGPEIQREKTEQLTFEATPLESQPQPPSGFLPSLTSAFSPLLRCTPSEENWMPNEGISEGFNLNVDRLEGFGGASSVQNCQPHDGASSLLLPGLFARQWQDDSLGNLFPPSYTPVPNWDIDAACKFFSTATMTPNQTADEYTSRRLSNLTPVMDKPAAYGLPNGAAIF